MDEEDYASISALQHWLFCPRQCALIHLEQMWSENQFTAEGRLLHERVHERGEETHAGHLSTRGLRILSRRLGIQGVADAVEFLPCDADQGGAILPGRDGHWKAFPVEYKRGRPKKHDADRIQLCAQAMCLEEMLQTDVLDGALFYGKTRRRESVEFTPELRMQVEEASREVMTLLMSTDLPPPTPGPKCRKCSLRSFCVPDKAGGRGVVSRYVKKALRGLEDEEI